MGSRWRVAAPAAGDAAMDTSRHQQQHRQHRQRQQHRQHRQHRQQPVLSGGVSGDKLGASFAQWRPGMKVSGMLVRNGKRVTITIHPDGTSDETEETAGSSAAYSYVSSSGGAGGTGTHIQITGSLGQAFADAVLPQTMQRMPIVGPALSTGLSWVPCIACVGCCYICCCRSAAPPGVGNPGLHKYQ